MKLSSLLLATTLLLAAPFASARDLYLVSANINDAYLFDLDSLIVSQKDHEIRGYVAYNIPHEGNPQGNAYVGQGMVSDCTVPGRIALLYVSEFDPKGNLTRTEEAPEQEGPQWMLAPRETHFYQLWLAGCKGEGLLPARRHGSQALLDIVQETYAFRRDLLSKHADKLKVQPEQPMPPAPQE